MDANEQKPSPRQRRHRIKGFVAAAGLVALLAVPATRSVIKLQARTLFGASAFGANADEDATQMAIKAGRIVVRHPDDSGLRVAYATRWAAAVPRSKNHVAQRPDEEHEATRQVLPLTLLQQSHRDDVLLDAVLLRRMSQDRLVLARREENLIRREGQEMTAEAITKAYTSANRPAALATFDRVAADGEKAAPNNAYFPFMRAVGLLVAHRDSEARAAMVRAGSCTEWNEYISAEADGNVRLSDTLYGESNAITHMAVEFSTLFPHYALLRGTARVFTGLAVEDELAGRAEEGFALRQALTHTGGQMRAKSSVAIGSLVGIAIGSIARTRPGGVPVPPKEKDQDNEGSERRAALAAEAYANYLQKIGHPREATVVRAEYDRGLVAKRAIHEGIDHGPAATTNLVWLGGAWGAGVLLTSNLLWWLLLGVLAVVLARTGPVKRRERLPSPMRWAAVLTAATLVLCGVMGSIVWEAVAGMAAIGGLVLFWLARKGNAKQVVQQFVTAALFTGGLLGITVFVGARLAGGVQGVASMLWVFDLHDSEVAPFPTALVAVVLSAGFPLVMAAGFAVKSKRQRVPVSAGLVRGFRYGATPAIIGLALTYTGVVAATAVWDRQVDAALKQMLQHEGRYYADYTDNKWPDPPAPVAQP